MVLAVVVVVVVAAAVVGNPLDIVRYVDMRVLGLHRGPQRHDQCPRSLVNCSLLYPEKDCLCYPFLATFRSEED